MYASAECISSLASIVSGSRIFWLLNIDIRGLKIARLARASALLDGLLARYFGGHHLQQRRKRQRPLKENYENLSILESSYQLKQINLGF
jgi:hypothetical protein